MVKKVAFGCFFLGESSTEGYKSFVSYAHSRVLREIHDKKSWPSVVWNGFFLHRVGVSRLCPLYSGCGLSRELAGSVVRCCGF